MEHGDLKLPAGTWIQGRTSSFVSLHTRHSATSESEFGWSWERHLCYGKSIRHEGCQLGKLPDLPGLHHLVGNVGVF